MAGQMVINCEKNVTGDERAHARNKSSDFAVFKNNEFDFSYKTWLYAVFCNIKFKGPAS